MKEGIRRAHMDVADKQENICNTDEDEVRFQTTERELVEELEFEQQNLERIEMEFDAIQQMYTNWANLQEDECRDSLEKSNFDVSFYHVYNFRRNIHVYLQVAEGTTIVVDHSKLTPLELYGPSGEIMKYVIVI